MKTLSYNVGGVLLDRPFKVRRLGHVGLNLYDMAAGVRFYKELLGFRIADVRRNFPEGAAVPERYEPFGDLNGYFMRHGSDHHSLVLYNHRFRLAIGRSAHPTRTVNQISWQVGSLGEVHGAAMWFQEHHEQVVRFARDMPGSNWHAYLLDPDVHQNELFYGMEQIGWDGHSKPEAMAEREFGQLPPLPQRPEYAEVNEALAKGVDLLAGYRDAAELPDEYDVQGIRLARPFKITNIGPVSLFVNDVAQAEAWYHKTLGFVTTEQLKYGGQRCAYLRNDGAHHTLALFPIALRSKLELRDDTTLASLGMQVGSYEQLLGAMDFLTSHGVTLKELPPELAPGMDHTILALDPDGHAIQLYWSMEQIGWDGSPRPAASRREIVAGEWPRMIPANGDSYAGEPFRGPLG